MTTSRIGNWNNRRFSFLRKERGQALTELALVLPVLMAILLSVAEMARVAYAAIEVSNAARAAVQYGDQNATTAADTAGMRTAASDDAANLASITTTVTTDYVCSSSTSWSGMSTTPPTCSGSKVQTILVVDTQATVNPLIHVWGLPTSYTVNGQAIQECLQC
jgi:Flp pilus assembly protein TadG